jgi:glyoxylase-like metal-dependent hydrolase (beta-lactamase superfamily II)/rhodanese-related sulfurtransferase
MAEQSGDVSVEQLLGKIDRSEPVLLLDVRNEEEYRQWKIEGREPVESAHIPYFDFIEDEAAATAKVPPHAGELIVVCAKGGSSAMVAELLRVSGTPAINLAGGMIAYGEYLQPVEVPLDEGDAGRFHLWQINRRGKGCLSYLIVSAAEAVVIDPSRNISVYETLAARAQSRITRVIETHVHADHVSGGPELAARHGASYAVDAGEDFELKVPADSLKDGDRIEVGHLTMDVLRTPGHTPGSVCYLIAGRYLISGDTVFTSAVGRPDLGGYTVEWARILYHTLQEKVCTLPPETLVLPAHYSGVSEIGPAGVVSARLGALRECLPELHASSEQDFVDAMVRAIRTPPRSYESIIRTNLGAEHPDAADMTEWELGKNQCAASAQR